MKTILAVFIFVLLFAMPSFPDDLLYSVHGIWIPYGEYASSVKQLSDGEYQWNGGGVRIDVYKGNPDFFVQGLLAKIDQISGKYPEVLLTINIQNDSEEYIGIIEVHFLAKDIIWFENRSDGIINNYINDAWIEFGKSNQYIRAKKIK